jgi:FlgD Ig-like domain
MLVDISLKKREDKSKKKFRRFIMKKTLLLMFLIFIIVNLFTLEISISKVSADSSSISFDMSEAGNVSIEIYNIRGQKVRTLTSHFNQGQNSIIWNGKDNNGKSLSSGMYFYKLKSGRFTMTKKMILMK